MANEPTTTHILRRGLILLVLVGVLAASVVGYLVLDPFGSPVDISPWKWLDDGVFYFTGESTEDPTIHSLVAYAKPMGALPLSDQKAYNIWVYAVAQANEQCARDPDNCFVTLLVLREVAREDYRAVFIGTCDLETARGALRVRPSEQPTYLGMQTGCAGGGASGTQWQGSIESMYREGTFVRI